MQAVNVVCPLSSFEAAISIRPRQMSTRSSCSYERPSRSRCRGSLRSTACASISSLTVSGRLEKQSRVKTRRTSSTYSSAILHRIRSYVSSRSRGNVRRHSSSWFWFRARRRALNWHATYLNLYVILVKIAENIFYCRKRTLLVHLLVLPGSHRGALSTSGVSRHSRADKRQSLQCLW
jgi:hypothetical protein